MNDVFKLLASTIDLKTKEEVINLYKNDANCLKEIKQEVKVTLLENAIIQLFAIQNKSTVEEEKKLFDKHVEERIDLVIQTIADMYFDAKNKLKEEGK